MPCGLKTYAFAASVIWCLNTTQQSFLSMQCNGLFVGLSNKRYGIYGIYYLTNNTLLHYWLANNTLLVRST